MKKFALILCAAFVIIGSEKTNAQAHVYPVQAKSISGITKDTLNDADTSYAVIGVENSSRSARVVVTKQSGNVSGVKIYLQGWFGTAGTSSDGEWDTLDSLTCTDQTTNKKVFALRSNNDLLYKDYRLFNKGAGTQQSVIKVYHLRRRAD